MASKQTYSAVLLALMLSVFILGLQFVRADEEDEYLSGLGGLGTEGADTGLDDLPPDELMEESPLPRITDEKSLKNFLEPSGTTFGGGVIGIFASESDKLKEQIQEFEDFSRPLNSNGYRFAVSVGQPAILNKYSVSGDNGWKIMVHPPPSYVSEGYGDKVKYRFGGNDVTTDAGKSALKSFVVEHYLPLVSRISAVAGNERMFIERRFPVFIVMSKFDESRDQKGVTYILNRIRKIGNKYRNRMSFAIISFEDAESTIYFRKEFFVKAEESSPAQVERIVGIRDGRDYYVMEGTFSVEAGQTFVDDFFAKKLEPVTVQEDMDERSDEEIEENVNVEL